MAEKKAQMGDFIGFSFNGIHSSELGLVRVSDGNRYEKNLFPAISDKTVQVPGRDGFYYFGSSYNTREMTVKVAFDNLEEKEFRSMVEHFKDKKSHFLWFDELPYKEYLVKVKSPPNFKYLCFDEDDKRIYKGEGTIIFVCYSPYARARAKSLSDWVNGVIKKEGNFNQLFYHNHFLDGQNSDNTTGLQVRQQTNLPRMEYYSGIDGTASFEKLKNLLDIIEEDYYISRSVSRIAILLYYYDQHYDEIDNFSEEGSEDTQIYRFQILDALLTTIANEISRSCKVYGDDYFEKIWTDESGTGNLSQLTTKEEMWARTKISYNKQQLLKSWVTLCIGLYWREFSDNGLSPSDGLTEPLPLYKLRLLFNFIFLDLGRNDFLVYNNNEINYYQTAQNIEYFLNEQKNIIFPNIQFELIFGIFDDCFPFYLNEDRYNILTPFENYFHDSRNSYKLNDFYNLEEWKESSKIPDNIERIENNKIIVNNCGDIDMNVKILISPNADCKIYLKRKKEANEQSDPNSTEDYEANWKLIEKIKINKSKLDEELNRRDVRGEDKKGYQYNTFFLDSKTKLFRAYDNTIDNNNINQDSYSGNWDDEKETNEVFNNCIVEGDFFKIPADNKEYKIKIVGADLLDVEYTYLYY